MRPKYKYDKNCQSRSSSDKENPDPKRQIMENPDPKRQMIYEANEAPSSGVVKAYKPGCDQYEDESQEKLQVKHITSTGTNKGPNEGTDESTKEDTEFKSSN